MKNSMNRATRQIMIQNIAIIFGTHICLKVLESPTVLFASSKIAHLFISLHYAIQFRLFFPLLHTKTLSFVLLIHSLLRYLMAASAFSANNLWFVSIRSHLSVLRDEDLDKKAVNFIQLMSSFFLWTLHYRCFFLNVVKIYYWAISFSIRTKAKFLSSFSYHTSLLCFFLHSID